jgi:hypothetical protein
MGDVDFLVDTKDLERCSELFEAVGMRRGDDGKHEYHREYYCNRRWAAAADAVTNGRPAAQRPPCF